MLRHILADAAVLVSIGLIFASGMMAHAIVQHIVVW
jgi:hypothetical protein